jgi:hypothetical protein
MAVKGATARAQPIVAGWLNRAVSGPSGQSAGPSATGVSCQRWTLRLVGRLAHNSLSFDLSDRSESGAEGMIGSSEAIDLRA